MPPICGVAKVLSDMASEDKRALLALLAAPIPATAVSRELEAAGYKTSYQTVYRHRTQSCSCDANE
jgi:hypothetical protein